MVKELYKISQCHNCELRTRCLKVIVDDRNGLSDDHRPIFIVSESPLQEDEQYGETLCDKSLEGVLLRKFLKNAEIAPLDVYKTTVVKCHSYGKIQQEHVEACKPWLWKQLQIIQPRVVVMLGAFPVKLLLRLKKEDNLERWVGLPIIMDYHSATFIACYSLTYMINHVSLYERVQKIFNEIKAKYV